MNKLSTQLTNPRAYKLFATGLFSFLVAYVAASVFMPVEASSATDISDTAESNMQVKVSYNPIAYYINVSSAHATTGSAISLDYSTSSTNLGNVIASSDTVSMKTNSPMNRYLYLSTNSSSNILSSSDESNGDSISAGGGDTLASASALSDNTWGFALPSSTSGLPSDASFDADYSSVSNSSKFAKVPTLNNEVLIQQASGSGDETDTSETTSTADVYYGVKGTSSLLAGTYSNTIKYTAFAESPDQLYLYPNTIDVSNPRQSILIYTDISTTDATIENETATVRIYTGSGHDTSGVETGTVGYCANATVSLYKENSTDTSGFVTVSCLALSLVAGSYGVEITLANLGRAIAKGSALAYENQTSNAFSSANITYLQDLTTGVCNSANSGDTFTLKDSRDGKSYSIAKLADGNCWMTQNLALDGGRDLTPADSDVTTTRTLPDNDNSGSDWSGIYDVAKIYSVVASQTTTADNGTGHVVISSEPYGNYYNWNAATATVGKQATTSTVYESICPRGWRLPDNTGSKAWNNLLTASGYPTDSSVFTEDILKIQSEALYIPLAGNIDGASVVNQTYGIWLWTRTTLDIDTHHAHLFNLGTSGFYSTEYNYNTKDYGFSVRCVLGENTENTMQNFTAAMCNALSISTSTADNRKVLQDARDGKLYNISRLADNPAGTNNGICWMVSNLALDGADSNGNVRTLTTNDSQVSGNVTLAANNDESFLNVWDEIKISSNGATTTDTYGSPYGNLYNWHTATAKSGVRATSGSASYSICPKGWRLPDNTGDRSYSNLMGKSGLSSTNTNNTAYTTKIQQQPLFFPTAGLFQDAHRVNSGNYGYYWSRASYNDNTNAHLLTFYTGNGYYGPSDGLDKYLGFSVRCVLGS